MKFRVGVENDNDDRSIAWALEHPGCFAYGKDASEAQSNFPRAAREYAAWIGSHGGGWMGGRSSEFSTDAVEMLVEETFNVYFIGEAFNLVEKGQGTMIESFFRYDWKPLTASDIESALKLLAWSRADLLAVVNGLSVQQLSRKVAGERWDINGILLHVGAAEWWYQERIGYPSPANESDLSSDPLERLASTREHFNGLLPQLEGMTKVIGLEGEIWSPRKVLRRLVWHERDHTEHIRKLL